MLRPSGLANFNFAYLVLPIALSTVCWLTIWLPWRLHRIVQAAAPRVDPYTEFGERRRDVTGEYERLLELDTSPFSFLYQGELSCRHRESGADEGSQAIEGRGRRSSRFSASSPAP